MVFFDKQFFLHRAGVDEDGPDSVKSIQATSACTALVFWHLPLRGMQLALNSVGFEVIS